MLDTVEDLEAYIKGKFVCEDGPQQAFYEELPLRPEYPNEVRRYVYTTYSVAVVKMGKAAAEALLVEKFLKVFKELPPMKIVWRVRPRLEEQPIEVWGDTFCTAEELEDGKVRQEDIPPECKKDFFTGNYRFLLDSYPQYSLYMRFVLPALVDAENALAGLVKPEGYGPNILNIKD